jgi:hypothetical protein
MNVKLPIVVRCDGAIFMAENSSSVVCTRHVDIRYHFIREHIEDGFIPIVFMKSCDHDADLFTKYVCKDVYNEHVDRFLGKVSEELEKRISEIGRVLECIPHILNPNMDSA